MLLAILLAMLHSLVRTLRRMVAVCFGSAGEFVAICGPPLLSFRRWLVVARGCIPPPRVLVVGLLVVAAFAGSCAVASAQVQVPTDSLVYYYNFENNLVDQFGANDLTATNAPGYATGKVGQGIDLESSSQQHLSCADNANLSTGDIDFSGDVWVKLESKDSNKYIVGKLTGASLEWTVDYLQSSDRFRFYVRSGGGVFAVAVADSLGSPSTGVWYHIYFEHDATNNFVRIRVNNGTTDSVATSGTAPPDTATPLRFGFVGSGTTQHFDGVIDEAAFWKRVLTSQEQTDRYNGGAGNTLILDAIYITRPRSPEIIQRKNATTGDIEIVGTYTYENTPPTAIEARVVWTNPSYTGDWVTLDAAPSSAANAGAYSGTLEDVPVGGAVGSGGVQTRFSNDTGVTAAAINTGVGSIYVTAGQSLMQGFAANLQPVTNTTGQLLLMLRETDTSWLTLADSTNSDAPYGTPIPQIASVLVASNPDVPLGFITACDGGTKLMLAPYEWRVPDGASYVDLLDSMTIADPNAVEGVLWGQGEAEAYEGSAGKDYYAALLPTLEAFHALPGNPWVLVNQCGMLPALEVDGAQAIREAQRKTWALDYVRPGAATHDIFYSVDALHPRTDAEVEEQATRIGWAMLGDAPPVMRAVKTTPASGTVEIYYNRTLTADASLSTAPWSVAGHTVSAASCDTEKVTLTVSPVIAAGEAISVTHASGNTALGVDVPRSSGGQPAAAETFRQSTGVYEVARPQ